MRILIPVFNFLEPTLFTSEDLRDILTVLGHDSGFMLIANGVERSSVMEAVKDQKYDMVMCVNYTRRMLWDVFRQDAPFVTLMMDDGWETRQKEIVSAFNSSAGDSIFGYIEHLKPLGYDASRLTETPIPVSPRKFHDKKRMDARPRGGHVFCATGKGWPIEWIAGAMEKACASNKDCFLTSNSLLGIANKLRELYDDRRTPLTLVEFSNFIQGCEPSVSWTMEKMGDAWLQWCSIFLYWRLHENVYRQAVARKLIGGGVNLLLAGEGWTNNPEFAGNSIPAIRHGKELARKYYDADSCLHVNGGGCAVHHRITEINLSGGRPSFLDKDWNVNPGRRMPLIELHELVKRQRSIVEEAIKTAQHHP